MERSNYGVRYSDGLDAEIPDVLSLIKACRLLLAEVRVATADGDEERLVLRPRLREGLFSPRVPVDRVVRVLAQVKAAFIANSR